MGKQTSEVVFEEQGTIYIAPADCGSTVGFRLTLEERLYAKPNDEGELGWVGWDGTIDMSDCSRSISWDIPHEDGLAKLDRAIAQLRAARKAVQAALKLYAQRSKALGRQG